MNLFDFFEEAAAIPKETWDKISVYKLNNSVISKADYKAGKFTQQQYYGQYVTDDTVRIAVACVGLDAIRAVHIDKMKDIPNQTWDRLAGRLYKAQDKDILNATGEDMDTSFFYIKVAKAAIIIYKEGIK